MLTLSPDTALLAESLATARGVPVGVAVLRALEASARAAGVPTEPAAPARRLSIADMLAVGAEIAALPILDQRSPAEIFDDVNAV